MDNTVFEAGKFLEAYEKNMSFLNVPVELKSSLPSVLYHYADFIEKNKPTEKQTRKKEDILVTIRQRILDEQRKHPSLDWAEIAARKIYKTYFDGENNILIKALEGDYCAVCGSKEFWNDEEE